MSLPKITTLPSYMTTPLNELKRDVLKSIKPIEKSSSPRNSPKAKSPRNSPKAKSPISSKHVKTLSKLQTIVEEKINDASILAPIKKRSHKKYDNRYPKVLPQITKLGGKKRTRKNKSNRRRTLRKK